MEGLTAARAESEKLAAPNVRLRHSVGDAAKRHEAELAAARAERDRVNGRAAELEVHGPIGHPPLGCPAHPDVRAGRCTALSSRSPEAIDAAGVLDGWHGYLTRDDYTGWRQYDDHYVGVQLCCQHFFRSLRAVLTLAPGTRKWAGWLIDRLREAGTLVAAARAAGRIRLGQATIDGLRARYADDQSRSPAAP